jgi:hypothetical protein
MFNHHNFQQEKRKLVPVVELLDERILPSATPAPVHSAESATTASSGNQGLVGPVILAPMLPTSATTTGGLTSTVNTAPAGVDLAPASTTTPRTDTSGTGISIPSGRGTTSTPVAISGLSPLPSFAVIGTNPMSDLNAATGAITPSGTSAGAIPTGQLADRDGRGGRWNGHIGCSRSIHHWAGNQFCRYAGLGGRSSSLDLLWRKRRAQLRALHVPTTSGRDNNCRPARQRR